MIFFPARSQEQSRKGSESVQVDHKLQAENQCALLDNLLIQRIGWLSAYHKKVTLHSESTGRTPGSSLLRATVTGGTNSQILQKQQ